MNAFVLWSVKNRRSIVWKIKKVFIPLNNALNNGYTHAGAFFIRKSYLGKYIRCSSPSWV